MAGWWNSAASRRRPDRPLVPDLQLEVDDAIATITLDRPAALNALTVPLKVELLSALTTIGADPAIRVVILTGAGRAFCAGQDLRERLEPAAAPLADELRDLHHQRCTNRHAEGGERRCVHGIG